MAKKASPQPLKKFLRAEHISLSALAAAAGYSRDHMTNVREGRAEASRECIAAVLMAARRLAKRPVAVEELFDLTPAQRRRKAS